MLIKWSEEITFSRQVIVNKIPQGPGVYKILQSQRYSRYRGQTRVLKIGISEVDLRKEISNHFNRHTAANRLARLSNVPNNEISVVFVLAYNESQIIEKDLLRSFEDDHWEVPVLNSQRGYARNEDRHFRDK